MKKHIKSMDFMKSSINKIIGGIIYIIFAFIIFNKVILSSNITNLFKLIITLGLVILICIGTLVLNVTVNNLFQRNDQEYNEKDDKHMLNNDFTDMFDSTPKTKTMKIILIKDVKGRGQKGEIIDVAIGLGNHMLASKNAIKATTENMQSIESEKG